MLTTTMRVLAGIAFLALALSFISAVAQGSYTLATYVVSSAVLLGSFLSVMGRLDETRVELADERRARRDAEAAIRQWNTFADETITTLRNGSDR